MAFSCFNMVNKQRKFLFLSSIDRFGDDLFLYFFIAFGFAIVNNIEENNSILKYLIFLFTFVTTLTSRSIPRKGDIEVSVLSGILELTTKKTNSLLSFR